MRATARGNINVILVFSLAILVFILGAIAGFFIWKQGQKDEAVAAPAYVNLGRVVAQVGGGRFVRTEVQLEIAGAEHSGLFESRRVQVLDRVRSGLGQMSEADLYSVQGKRKAQEAIVAYLNHYFGKPLVLEVYFSNFMVAGG
ncbi:flagellar basal body-associated protein FliL [Azovibrio restrictus]|uniref:flagellar basal body-associated FliL family protein n=1 Tax=Azovibrio restrictus TaxID=146938 RepID=UPI0026F04801|nr:flagellar basal body-associated FliL family protein [Azovibrio restrictus]